MLCSMNRFALPNEKINELRETHRACKNKRDADRIKAIILLACRWSYVEIATALLLDEETIRNYQKRYEKGELAELLTSYYQGSECSLTSEQLSQLEAELEKSIYMTTQSVIEYVKVEFSIEYSVSGMRDLLHRMDYEYKKPKLVPGNPDIEAQEIFAQQYDDFMATKPDDIEVVFADAVHPEHNTMAAYGWIKRGQVRKLKTNSGRERLNLHGAMNAETYKVTVIESKTVNSESTIDLFDALEQAYPVASQIMVILDNARYHFSKEVKAYLAMPGCRIRLVPLPSYSPNLNLIERLWKFFKKNVLYNRYYKNVAAFRSACIDFFRNIDVRRDEMINFIGHDFELA